MLSFIYPTRLGLPSYLINQANLQPWRVDIKEGRDREKEREKIGLVISQSHVLVSLILDVRVEEGSLNTNFSLSSGMLVPPLISDAKGEVGKGSLAPN